MNDPVEVLASAETRRIESLRKDALDRIDSLTRELAGLKQYIERGEFLTASYVTMHAEALKETFAGIAACREKLDLLRQIELATRSCASCEARGVELRIGSTSDPEGKPTDAPFCRPCIDAGANHGTGAWEELKPLGAGKEG